MQRQALMISWGLSTAMIIFMLACVYLSSESKRVFHDYPYTFLRLTIFVFQRRSVRQYKPVEFPIFKRQDAPFSSPQGITHMVASNGWISLVQPGNIIYRFHLDNPRGAAERKIT